MDDLMNNLMGLFANTQKDNTTGDTNVVENHDTEQSSTDTSSSGGDDIGNLLASLLGGLGDSSQNSDSSNQSNNDNGGGDGFDIGMLLQLQGLLSGISGEDNSTKLLYALKPYLADERQSKVEKAVKILKIVKMIPAIRQTGLLEKFLG